VLSGKGHPTLTRRRMRLMSLATLGPNVGLLGCPPRHQVFKSH
jgi:hypothetical protein